MKSHIYIEPRKLGIECKIYGQRQDSLNIPKSNQF